MEWKGIARTRRSVRRNGYSWAPKRVVEVLREEGVKSLWFKILGETVYRRLVLFERLLDEPIPEATPRLPVTIDLLRRTEVEEYSDFRQQTHPLEIRRRLEAGEWCFVARHEGRLLHAGWAATRQAWIDSLSSAIRLAPDEVYVYDFFTLPEFRNRNIALARGAKMLRYFRDAGYRRVVAVISPGSRRALRPFEKLGYRPFGVIGRIKLGPWQRDSCWVNSKSGRLHRTT